MTTWEDAVKFLHKQRCAGGAFDLLWTPCERGREAWRKRDDEITTRIYSRNRDEMRALRTNDLRYARQLDKGE